MNHREETFHPGTEAELQVSCCDWDHSAMEGSSQSDR